MEKGFLPKIYGGLGNQLFIVVSSWILAREHNCPLYIPKQSPCKNKHNTNALDYYKSVLSYFGTHIHIKEEDLLANVAWPVCKRYGFAPWKADEFQPGSILDSYFQYYPPFAQYEKEIRERILRGLGCSQKKEKQWCFLHIRRGDYLNAPNFHYIQPMEYYRKAIDLVMQSSQPPEKILIFSDDIAWVESQELFSDRNLFEYVKGIDEVESLALMASCTTGAICANSTFSWWGAFLGAYAKRNPVIVPSRWIGETVYSLFPSEWICIDT